MFAVALAMLLPVALAPQAPAAPAAPAALVVCGMVLDGELRPAGGVPLATVEDGKEDVAAALLQPLGRSGDDGTFRLELSLPPSGTRWLVVGGARHATMMHQLTRTSGPVLDLGAFALAPGQQGVGRVRDAAGAPIAGARVVAADLLDSRAFLREGRGGLRFKCRTVATTQPSGIFRLPGMVLSAGQLTVQCDGWCDEVLQPVALGDPLDVTLTAAPTIHGRVLDADGKAVEGASVNLGQASCTTDADGRFVLRQRQRGERTLRASKRIGGQWLSVSGELDATGTAELKLPAAAAAPAPLRVVARTAQGEPVREFTAWVCWSAADQLPYRPDALLLVRGSTEKSDWMGAATDGTATLAGPSPRDREVAMVFVRAEGFGWARVEAGADALGGQPVVVKLLRQAVLRGRVVDRKTGAGIAGAEVIATQNLTDTERQHYSRGFRTVTAMAGTPMSAKTAADGSYQLSNVPPGACDLLLSVPGRIELPPVQTQVTEGEQRGDVDFQVPANLPLRASVQGKVAAGTQVRVHWHRPNMSSSAWASEFGGAVAVAADGTFTLPELQPKQDQVQLLATPTPRGGQRMKLALGIWDGAAPDAATPPYANPALVLVAGKVQGDIPWSRLAVAAQWQAERRSFQSTFNLGGPVALLQPDRSFRIAVPSRRCHLLLFDVLTGVAFEWQEIGVDGPLPNEVALVGTGKPVALRLLSGGEEMPAGSTVTVGYEPDTDHWPDGVGDLVPRNMIRGQPRTGMTTDARVGDTLTLWVPARTGVVRVRRGSAEVAAIDLDGAADGPIEVRVEANAAAPQQGR